MEQQQQEKRLDKEGHQESREACPCKYCGSNTRRDIVKAALWSNRGLVAIEDISARGCEGCGEQFYDEETTETIEKLVTDSTAKAKQQVLVPVFSLAEVEVPQRGSRPEALDEQEIEAIESVFAGTEQRMQKMPENQGSQQPFLCTYCQSNTHEDVVKSALWTARGLVAIEDVPARVCQQCGERFYDEETVRKIEELTEAGFPAEKAKREILAPLFSLAEMRDLYRPSRHL